MKSSSTPPGLKTSFETDKAIDATSGKTDSARMSRTAGQMKNQRAAPSERHAPSVSDARRVARPARSGPVRTGSGSRSIGLLGAKTGDVRGELLVLSDLVSDRVPAIGDGRLCAGLV